MPAWCCQQAWPPALWLWPLLALTYLQLLDAQASPGLLPTTTLPDDSKEVKASCLLQLQASAPASEVSARKLPAARVSLASSSTSSSDASSSASHHENSETSLLASKEKSVPAGWFGDFSHGESTYDPDGVGDHPDYPEKIGQAVRVTGDLVNMGAQEAPMYHSKDGLPSEWFEESISGGRAAAWRTQFPPLEAFRNEGMRTVPWLPARSGRTEQPVDLVPARSIAGAFDITKKKDAYWFDESIRHYDDFGRFRPPGEDNDRFYHDWETKTWEVPFGCSSPGCTANATMKTFDAKKLQHAKCKLDVGVHVTDFDDEYSREFVEWIIVNEAHLSTHCDPMGKGCNKSVSKEARGLHPCVSDYPLDTMIAKSTTLNIAGKISDMVDECPVGDNLLSGVARLTCFVKPWPHQVPPDPILPGKNPCNDTTPLRCRDRGCIANATAIACHDNGTQVELKEGQKCTMSVKIWQTDFDNDHGSKELVEWVMVNGKTVKTDLNPGRNPCKEVFDGKPPSNESLALQKGNLTAEPEDLIGLDAQSRALLANLPGGDEIPLANCRRRVVDQMQAGASSRLLKDSEESHRPHKVINHLRAAPDTMKEIVSGVDVTKEVFKAQSIEVAAKISEMVDECAKDSYLLNSQVSIVCK